MQRFALLAVVALCAPFALGGMIITEWMYNGAGSGSTGEFVEFTNVSGAAIDMTGWSFDDDSRTPGTVDLSAFGLVAPGQSVILTDETAATFTSVWALSGVAVIGGNSANLGRNDEINLFDNTGALAARLTYGDQNYAGTPRTQLKSCNIPVADYGVDVVKTTWTLAAVGDSYGSWASTRGEVGSPGVAALPEPATLGALAVLGMLVRRR